MFILQLSMREVLFKRDKIILLLIWSFFSFSVIKLCSVFFYKLNHSFLYYASLYSLLFFIYHFVFKIRFDTKLNYQQYTISNILFVILITMLSYCYYRLIMLDNDYFGFNFFIVILISNLLFASLLFPFTLIKRK